MRYLESKTCLQHCLTANSIASPDLDKAMAQLPRLNLIPSNTLPLGVVIWLDSNGKCSNPSSTTNLINRSALKTKSEFGVFLKIVL